MSYKVTLDGEEGIVRVALSGQLAHADHCAVLDEVVRICQEARIARVLVDMRQLDTALSSVMDCFVFGESLAKRMPSVRIAHVAPLDAKSRKDVTFTSTVEANRGVLSAQFETLDEAEEWLRA